MQVQCITGVISGPRRLKNIIQPNIEARKEKLLLLLAKSSYGVNCLLTYNTLHSRGALFDARLGY